jgi:hypothetical protein
MYRADGTPSVGITLDWRGAAFSGESKKPAFLALRNPIFVVGVPSPLWCAGINRYEIEDERALRERSSDPLGPESCAVTARDTVKRRQGIGGWTPTFAASVTTFAATNADDLLLLTVFFARGVPGKRIVLGQYLGLACIVLISLLGLVAVLAIPHT